MVRFDDPRRPSRRREFATDGARFFFTITQDEGDIWVAYPMNPAPGQAWLPWTWLALGAAGTLVQMYWTGDREVGKRVKKSAE
jgi:hypothetical protein